MVGGRKKMGRQEILAYFSGRLAADCGLNPLCRAAEVMGLQAGDAGQERV